MATDLSTSHHERTVKHAPGYWEPAALVEVALRWYLFIRATSGTVRSRLAVQSVNWEVSCGARGGGGARRSAVS